MARDAKAVENMNKYFNELFGSLVGKTVKGIIALNDKDIESMGWDPDHDTEAFGVLFTDGTFVVPMQDPEGNGPGFFFLQEVE